MARKQHLYCVYGAFIHPHKDSTGEYFDNLTYDEAAAICRVWQKDRIHKNVHILGSNAATDKRGFGYGKACSRT